MWCILVCGNKHMHSDMMHKHDMTLAPIKCDHIIDEQIAFWTPTAQFSFLYSSNQDNTVGDEPAWATLVRLQIPGRENRCTEMLQRSVLQWNSIPLLSPTLLILSLLLLVIYYCIVFNLSYIMHNDQKNSMVLVRKRTIQWSIGTKIVFLCK
jgi:hypothetical protein